MDDATQTFLQESSELLVQMEDALLALEDEPQDSELINSVFRAMHTIKGAAGIFGFDPVVEFTHVVESVMDQVRGEKRPVDSDLIAQLLQCKDHTALLIEVVVTGDGVQPEHSAQGDQILSRLTGQSINQNMPTSVAESTAGSMAVAVESDHQDDHWIISLQFKPDAFRNGIDPLSFFRYLNKLGQVVQVETLTTHLPTIEEADPESCYLGFVLLFVGEVTKADLQAVFEFAYDDCELAILPPSSEEKHYIDLLDTLSEDQSRRIGEMLLEIGAVTAHELSIGLNTQIQADKAADPEKAPSKPVGEILVERQVVSPAVVEKALHKQDQVRQKVAQEARLIRVDSEKLGRLINLVGELVISNAAIKLMVDRHHLPDMSEVVASSEHLVEEIRDHALQLRMVQIGETFSRFKRVVRDVSRDLHKEIELVITGGETELDKTVVEKINDPLTHLIRNSLDHGIEMPETRIQNGKPAQGTLSLNAFHDSGHIVIQIIDDGAGLDLARIRAKAEASGLIKPDQSLTDKELALLIFEAGLSTKEQANNLSGRGVGMDVVRRNIEALRGSVEVDTEAGLGTTVTIHLPLTLAIIDGFMVGARDERYIIPLAMVEECVEMNTGEWELNEERHYVNLRGEVMPYLRLNELFDIPETAGASNGIRESLVIVRVGANKAGFVVDELHGELQTVIKPLGKLFQRLKGISGSTVLGSGEVALILDVQGIINIAMARMQK